MNFEIWRDTFLKSFLALRNYGMDFRSLDMTETLLARHWIQRIEEASDKKLEISPYWVAVHSHPKDHLEINFMFLRFTEVWTQRVMCKVSDALWVSLLTLHRTHCVHTSMNLKKGNSSLIFKLCFYITFIHYLWNFNLNLANKQQRKVTIRRVWLLRPTAVTMTWL